MMKKIVQPLFCLLFLAKTGYAQEITPELLGFKEEVLQDVSLGEINYYITDKSNKPLLFYLDGSGSLPLFQYTPRGIGSTVVIDWQNLKKDFDIVLISKPGIPFADSINYTDTGIPMYEEPAIYKQKLSLEWRSEAANLVINQLLTERGEFPVIVFGVSEGAQVAANLAAINDKVTHLMMFSGNGLDQLFSEIINQRLQAERGILTHSDAQKNIDSLHVVFEDIWENTENTKDNWYGHTYQRWASFSNSAPVDALIILDIPIFMAVGTRDNNPVLSADYIKFLFLKEGKKNLTYKAYPDHDHSFNYIQFTESNQPQIKPNRNMVLEEAFDWLETQLD